MSDKLDFGDGAGGLKGAVQSGVDSNISSKEFEQWLLSWLDDPAYYELRELGRGGIVAPFLVGKPANEMPVVISDQTLGDVAATWVPLVGGENRLTNFLSFSEAQERQLKDATQPMVMLVELTQLTEDPLLSLLLEAMRQKGYFATQGGAVHLVFLDTTTQEQEQAIAHTDTTLANVNFAHNGTTQLSRELASVVVAGRLAEAETLAQAMQTKIPAPTTVLIVAEAFGGTAAHDVADAFAATWYLEIPAEQRYEQMIVVPIISSQAVEPPAADVRPTEATPPAPEPSAIQRVMVTAPAIRAALDIASAPPQERAGVAATMQESYGVPVAQSDNPLVPFLPVPQLVEVTAEVDTRLRTFQATARGT